MSDYKKIFNKDVDWRKLRLVDSDPNRSAKLIGPNFGNRMALYLALIIAAMFIYGVLSLFGAISKSG